MDNPLYNVTFRGGPLHNQVKPYPYERPEMSMSFFDMEIVRPFNVAGDNYAIGSTADMQHVYQPSRIRDENNNVVYFYESTIVTERRITKENRQTSSPPVERKNGDSPESQSPAQEVVS